TGLWTVRISPPGIHKFTALSSYTSQATRAKVRLPAARSKRRMVSIEDARRRTAAPRIPPHNLEAEESLLGAMMLSREAITASVEARLEAADFYKPAHGAIFEAAFGLHQRGEPVDPVTVAEELRRTSQLEQLGGRQTLLRIQAATPASANAQ